LAGGTRRDARERALALLYEAEAKGQTPTEVLAALPVPPDEYAAALVAGVEAVQDEADGLIREYARGWALERMPAVDRTLLRIAVFELQERPDVPTAVVIDEAVALAKEFSTDGSGRFVNGVLARIARELRGVGSVDESDDNGEPGGVAVLLVDVDGVIRHWHSDEIGEAEVALGVPAGSLVGVAFEETLLRRALIGELTDGDWRDEVGRRMSARFGVDAAEVSRFWTGMGWRIDEDVLDLLRAVRAGGRCRVALFSNATDRLEIDLASCGVDAAVDEVVNSSRLGLAKPDPAAFAAAAALLGSPASACLFVDDRAENVDGARAAGMRAELFTGVGRLRDLVQASGLLPAGK
jgi:transcription antitermination factor NusB